MADQQTTDSQDADLPEGTDTVIEGAAITTEIHVTETPELVVATAETTTTTDTDMGSTGTETGTGGSRSSRSSGVGLAERLRSGREQLSGQAGEKARGLVTQGLERTAEALANVSRMVGDTAPGIEERLGAEYGDYARRAAGSIENVANNIAGKDPDELIDDTRNFVRNSPGIALAGAAVVGFVVARLVKSGLGTDVDDGDEDEDRDGEGSRA